MKLRAKLLSFTAAIALSAGMAFAAIDGDALAQSYLDAGYTYVVVEVGPTQTKVVAVQGDIMMEVIYDNETGLVIESEAQAVEDDYAGLTGMEVDTVDEDFTDGDEGGEGEGEGEGEGDEGGGEGEGGGGTTGGEGGGEGEGGGGTTGGEGGGEGGGGATGG